MPDLSHQIRQDLSVDPTGDLAVSDGSQLGQERVLRRLCTSPGNYIWNADYGAGLARFLGRPMAALRVSAITRSQMFKEAAVARIPAPSITVTPYRDGTMVEDIKYVDADTGTTTTLSFPVS